MPTKGYHPSLEHRAKNALAHTGKHHSPETKAKMSIAKKGSNNPSFWKGKVGPWKGKHRSPETCAKMSIAIKQKCADNPAWNEARQRVALSSSRKHPNGLEKHLMVLISKHSLPFKYTGNGSIWINGQNPDFINVNGEKVVVEVNGCYWHGCKRCGFGGAVSEVERVQKYAEYGFRTIEIWEHDKKDIPKLLQMMRS